MYLVYTSVWIDYFRDLHTSSVEHFINLLDKKIPFGITGIIFQEILQGASTLKDFNHLNDYLVTQEFFHPSDNFNTYQSAAKIYFNCRKKGITIRSTVNCLIAQIAIEHNLILLHNDHDFELIKKVHSELELY